APPYIAQWTFPANGVASDAYGDIYATDTSHHLVRKFSASGTVSTQWALDLDDGRPDLPTWIAVDADGNVYVTDSGNHRVQKFTGGGETIDDWLGWEIEPFTQPVGIVAVRDVVYLVDNALVNRHVKEFTNRGNFAMGWGQGGGGQGEFDAPQGI